MLTTVSSERRRLSSSSTSLICFVRRFCIQEDIWDCIFRITKVTQFCLKKKNSSGYWNCENVEISITAFTAVYPVSYLFIEKYHIRYYLYHTITCWGRLIRQLYIAYTSTQKWELLHRDSNACRTDSKYILSPILKPKGTVLHPVILECVRNIALLYTSLIAQSV